MWHVHSSEFIRVGDVENDGESTQRRHPSLSLFFVDSNNDDIHLSWHTKDKLTTNSGTLERRIIFNHILWICHAYLNVYRLFYFLTSIDLWDSPEML